VHLGQLAQTEAMGTITEQGFPVNVEPRTADILAFQLSSPHTGPHALNNKVTFQFGNSADDDHHGAAQWTARVELFTEADELQVEVVQLIEYFQEVPDGACDTIARPHQDYIEAATTGIGHHLVETRAAGFGSRDLVRCNG
jgi:hypothetical protein